MLASLALASALAASSSVSSAAAGASEGPGICEPTRVDLRNVSAVSGFFGAAAAGHDGGVYVFGGHATGGMSNALHRYDVTTHGWQSLPVRGLVKRRYASAAVLDGKLYLVGGSDGTSATDVVERVDLATFAVERLPNLPKAVAFPGVAAWQGALWVAGGETRGKVRSDEVFVLAPNDPAWRKGAALSAARDMRLVVLDDTLWALPGYDGKRALAIAEKLSPGGDAWTKVEGAPAVSGFGTGVVDGRAILFGDYEDQSSIRWFDGMMWHTSQEPMIARRHAAVASAKDAKGREIVVVAGGNRKPEVSSALAVLEAFELRCRAAGEPSCTDATLRANAAKGFAAPPAWAAAVKACGVGQGLGAKLARAYFDDSKPELAAEALIAELTAGAATPQTIALAIELARKDRAARTKLLALGRTAATAVPSHGIKAQRPWLAALGCPSGDKPERPKQSLTKDNFDRWSFTCAGTPTEMWFDFSSISVEAAP